MPVGISNLPFDAERAALDAAARLDFIEARDRLGALAARVGALAEPETAALFLYALFGRLADLVCKDAPGAAITKDRAITALSSARDSGGAVRSFVHLVDDLFQPFIAASGAHPVVARSKWFIEENHARKLSLRDVSDYVNVSPNYLSSLFRRECGMTLTEYLHRVRLRRAEVLLLAGEKSLSEIAYQVGYQTYRDFYRNFVKQERSSPSRFRRTLARRSGLAGAQTTTG